MARFLVFLACLPLLSPAAVLAQERARSTIGIDAEILNVLPTPSLSLWEGRGVEPAQWAAAVLLHQGSMGRLTRADSTLVSLISDDRTLFDRSGTTFEAAFFDAPNQAALFVRTPPPLRVGIGFDKVIINNLNVVLRNAEIMRKSNGITLFLVQVCACSL